MPLEPLKSFTEVVATLPADEFVEVGGQRIHCERWGDRGPVVVLLHGFAASTYSFRKLGPLMGETHQVVAIDLNGFGYTERPADPEHYAVEGQAMMVAAALEKLLVTEAVVLGHSFGALVALELVHRFPDLVSRLVLVSPAMPDAEAPWFLRLPGSRWGMHLAIRLLLSNAGKFRQVLSRAFFRKDEVTAEVAEAYRTRLLVEGLPHALKGLASPPTVNPAACPLSPEIIAGSHDEIVPLRMVRAFAGTFPGATLDVLVESGHSGPEEEPEEVARILARRLRPEPAGSGAANGAHHAEAWFTGSKSGGLVPRSA